MPDTALAHAFLAALLRWAQRRGRNAADRHPAGAVDRIELQRVVMAILAARADALITRRSRVLKNDAF
jgi:hypothetical protein